MKFEQKGILANANRFRLFGVRMFWLGVVWHSCREGRFIELVISTWFTVLNWTRPVAMPKTITGMTEFCECYQKFAIPSGGSFIARREAIYQSNSLLIAGEYGQPGARILMVEAGQTYIFDPYLKSGATGVWHLHAIFHLDGQHYLVSTGDSSKFLDLMHISVKGCQVLKRLVSHAGGYTAITAQAGEIWMGSDLSERANYIERLEGRLRYFLPHPCVGEYIIHMEPLGEQQVLVMSRRLGTFNGHALIFCTKQRCFVAANAVSITGYMFQDANLLN